jgi:RNA polymerase sigma-70 factor (ECF subfamily)
MGHDTFEALVSAHHGEILRFLRRVTGGRDIAEDLCQETFLRAFRAYKTQDVDGNRRAWLFVIATNLARNHARGERRRGHAQEILAARVVIRSDDRRIHSRDIWENVRKAVLELPPKQRLALTLRKFHDSDYTMIASCLKCSRESARANVFQALKALRHRLNGATVKKASP